jgi:hypothetical protein
VAPVENMQGGAYVSFANRDRKTWQERDKREVEQRSHLNPAAVCSYVMRGPAARKSPHLSQTHEGNALLYGVFSFDNLPKPFWAKSVTAPPTNSR